jgi:hypothetical protein
LQKRVAEEQADSLRLLIVVGGHGAFVAAFRNHPEIVRAHANRESPKPAARPFPVRSHSLGRCRHGCLFPWRAWWHETRSQGLNGPEALNGLAGSRSGYGPIRRGRSGMPGDLDTAPAHGRCSLDRLRCPVFNAGGFVGASKNELTSGFATLGG